jgi:biopolymer transport protein ExbD
MVIETPDVCVETFARSKAAVKMRIPSSHVHSRERRDDGVMTPMIDVVFLLLIFFVCAAAGHVRESVLATEMTAPGSVESQQPVEREPWTVEVWLALRLDETGSMVVSLNQGEQFRDLRALEQRLAALAEIDPENPVILDVGPRVPMRDFIAVYDTCLKAGFETPSIAARAADLRR